jgi:hypothetical protein
MARRVRLARTTSLAATAIPLSLSLSLSLPLSPEDDIWRIVCCFRHERLQAWHGKCSYHGTYAARSRAVSQHARVPTSSRVASAARAPKVRCPHHVNGTGSVHCM